jgi:hypothetical protein
MSIQNQRQEDKRLDNKELRGATGNDQAVIRPDIRGVANFIMTSPDSRKRNVPTVLPGYQCCQKNSG